MVHTLKHFAFRLWVTVLIGSLANLRILPAFQSKIGLEWAIFPVFGILAGVFIAAGWLGNRLGLNIVERKVREAAEWERDSMHPEAEAAYKRAVAVFDSFLLSPGNKKKRSSELSSRLARFYLARAEKSQDSESFVISYLKSHPDDEEVAENWLQQSASRGDLMKSHEELVLTQAGIGS